MAEEKPKKTRRKKKGPAEPRGLSGKQVGSGVPPADVMRVMEGVESSGGSVIGPYREPLAGHWQIVAALPVELVEPTPYQRDLSEPHVARLADAMEKLGRYMDPIVAVPSNGKYWTPNGNHRLAALKRLGVQSVLAVIAPEPEVAHRILVLNTEKAHNVRERALEVIRLARALAELDDRAEQEYATEFEEPSLLTLGLCYLENGRFSGGAYQPVLKRTETWSSQKLSKSLDIRRERAIRLLALDAAVAEAVRGLKERGLESPYLKAFVIARINPLRWKKGGKADPDEIIAQMLGSAKKFDVGKVKPDQVARAGGAPDEA